MTDLQRTVDDHSTRIALLEQSRDDHQRAIDDLRESERAILERLGATATHEDIVRVESSINGVLRDALNAVPEHAANQIATQANRIASRANVWFSIAGIGSLVAAVVVLAEHYK